MTMLAYLLLLAAQPTSRALEVEFRVAKDPQIAVWLETADGQYVDTLMVTRLVGTFGLGNRPGHFYRGSGHLFPYGRREMTLPVWAHRRNVRYERLVFQDCGEGRLGWHESVSSAEPFYCRPTNAIENSVDAISCPTTRFSTDKGMPQAEIKKARASSDPEVRAPYEEKECDDLMALNFTDWSLYPPRNDISIRDPSRDWSSVLDLRRMNDLDAVSRATPRAQEPFRLSYVVPPSVADGDYVVWVEVSQQYDFNSAHSYDFTPDPMLEDYGIPYQGQPSLVWKLPVAITATASEVLSNAYVGYGAPDGQDGQVRPPDASISLSVPGSGAERLLRTSGNGRTYQLRLVYTPDADCPPPTPVSNLKMADADWAFVDLSLTPTAQESDTVASYEIRYAEGKNAITNEADFTRAIPGPDLGAGAPGQTMSIRLDLPRPETTYTVAIRAYNHCGQPSELTFLEVATEFREFQTVDACFIATAAYGDIDQSDVKTLRRFRDRYLNTTAGGRELVDLYYQLSPPIADLIRDRPALRALTRGLLQPMVRLVGALEP